MENRQRILETLDSWGVAYRLITHEAVYTIADCLRLEGIDWSVTEVPKNVFLCNRQQTSYYLALLRHDLPFRTAVVSRALGVSRLSFAPPDALETLLRLTSGSLSPLALMYDTQGQIRLCYEPAVRNTPRIAFHPCDNAATVIFSQQVFWERVLPLMGVSPAAVSPEAAL